VTRGGEVEGREEKVGTGEGNTRTGNRRQVGKQVQEGSQEGVDVGEYYC